MVITVWFYFDGIKAKKRVSFQAKLFMDSRSIIFAEAIDLEINKLVHNSAQSNNSKFSILHSASLRAVLKIDNSLYSKCVRVSENKTLTTVSNPLDQSMKWICHAGSRGWHISVTTGIWSLAHESDHQAEIWESIVRYDALAPRAGELMSWYRLRMRDFPRTGVLATFLRKRIRVGSIKYETSSWHLLVPVYFILKLGIGNNKIAFANPANYFHFKFNGTPDKGVSNNECYRVENYTFILSDWWRSLLLVTSEQWNPLTSSILDKPDRRKYQILGELISQRRLWLRFFIYL